MTLPLCAASWETLERAGTVLLAHDFLAAAAQRQCALCGYLRREGGGSENHHSHRRGPQRNQIRSDEFISLPATVVFSLGAVHIQPAGRRCSTKTSPHRE